MHTRIVVEEAGRPSGTDLVHPEPVEVSRGTLRVEGLNLDIPLTITRTARGVRFAVGPFANESGGTVLPRRVMRRRAA